MSELMPVNWTECKLGDVVSVIRGVTFPASSKVHESISGYVACLRTSHIQEKLLWDNIYYIPVGYIKRSDQVVRRSDILMSMANSSSLVGKVCINETDREACFGAFLSAIRSREINHKYVYCYLKSSEAQQTLRASASQTVNIANISVGALEELRFPLAPLAEQTRIAAKLDELLAQVDTLKARIDGIPALLKRFRQSVLAAAVSGRLTEEWRATCADFAQWSEDLIEAQVKAERLEKGFKQPKRKGERVVPPIEAPREWVWLRAADISLKITDGAHSTPKVKGEGFPYITAKDLSGDSLDFSEGKFISEMEHRELYNKCRPDFGDLLVVNIGAGTGNNALVDVGFEFSFKNVAIIKRSGVVLPEFLKIFFDSRKGAIFHEQTQGGAQPFLSLTTLGNIEVALPNLAEQAEIVRRVEQLLAFADQLGAKVNEAKTRIDRLTQSILAKAFRGELVPQDPNDEPASELLARIQAQRAGAPKARRGRNKVV